MMNDLGLDPNEWFEDPPRPEEEVADNLNNYITDEYAPCDVEYDFPAELKEVPTSLEPYASRFKSTPDFEKVGGAEEIVSMHEKMYRIATDRYNPFSVGGSENCRADIDCPIGGSENLHK